ATTADTTEEPPVAGDRADEDEVAEQPAAKKGRKPKAPEEPAHEKIEVTKMLALAEGRADDPTGKSPREKKAAVAYFGLRLLTLFFIGSIVSMVYLDWEL